MVRFFQRSLTSNLEMLQVSLEDSPKCAFPCKSNEKDSAIGRKTNQLSSWGKDLGFCYEVPQMQDQGPSSADFLFKKDFVIFKIP